MQDPSRDTDVPARSTRAIFRHDFTGQAPDPEPLLLAKEAPPWRRFGLKTSLSEDFEKRPMNEAQVRRGRAYQAEEFEARMVSAALVLRRPLLVAGQPGVGKTSLAYAVAWQLGLGNVLRWSITSRSTLKDALYQYDAIARLHDTSLRNAGDTTRVYPYNIGQYITLGPLGTALLPHRPGPYQPRVLLIDEIDKSDIDLPNDLLHVLEEGEYEITEITRLGSAEQQKPVPVRTADAGQSAEIPPDGRVICDSFPLVILTTNDEREFPPAFLRRCIRLTLSQPRGNKLRRIVQAQLELAGGIDGRVHSLIERFDSLTRTEGAHFATDQLINAIYLLRSKADVDPLEHSRLLAAIFQSLTQAPALPEE